MEDNAALSLKKREQEELVARIETDYKSAISSHSKRMERFRRYYQLWRGRVDPPAVGDEEKSNFAVPLVEWNVFLAWAQEMDSLFGDDAEIVAVPHGESDHRVVAKVGRYATIRWLRQSQMPQRFTRFSFMKVLFGRAHAYAPYWRDTYVLPDGQRETWFEGCGFFPLWPDELIVPPERAETIQDFSFVIRRVWQTPQELLDGERSGRYQGISEHWDEILSVKTSMDERDADQVITNEVDKGEGVEAANTSETSHKVQVWEWYGRYRPGSGRSKKPVEEKEIVVFVLPDLSLYIGARDLRIEYPRTKNRRPFVEASLVKDGSYWSKGAGEMLESIQDEASANHNLFTEAGEFSVGPCIFFRKDALDPQSGPLRMEPGMAIPCEDPGSIKEIRMQADLQYPVIKEQSIIAYAERVMRRSDMSLGRASDRPNAPRTAAGQAMMLEQGNIGVSLDTRAMRDDVTEIFRHFWDLESMFASEKTFFRVTEEEANGLFDVHQGGAYLTSQERSGRYDFSIKFATSRYGREANKERFLQLYQLLLANPVMAMNQALMAAVAKKLCKVLEVQEIGNLIQVPPPADIPKTPAEEYTLILQGERVPVHPQDNDNLHLVEHYHQLELAMASEKERDPLAEKRLAQHIQQQIEQQRMKMQMQALTQMLTDQVAAATQDPSIGGLNFRGPVPIGLQQLGGVIQGMGSQQVGGQQPGGGGMPGANNAPGEPA